MIIIADSLDGKASGLVALMAGSQTLTRDDASDPSAKNGLDWPRNVRLHRQAFSVRVFFAEVVLYPYATG